MPFGSRGRKGGDTVRAAVESSPSLTPRRIRLTHAAVRRTDLFRVTMLGVVLAGAGCSPRGPEALRRGDQALVAGRVAEAIPLLEQAVTDLPGNAAAWNQLGLAYHAAGRDAEAQKAYLRALNDDRNFFDAHFNLGALQFEQRRWQESERSLRTYLGMEANRTNAAAWRMLGDALLGSRQMDSAERALNTAAQLDPDEASVQNSLGLVLVAKRRPRDAQARFSQAVRMNPQDPGARLNLAIITQQLGDRRAALEQYRAYLALTPAPPDADRVADLVRQMEAQLLPPPLVTTNRIAVTNAVAARPPRAATNLATAVPAPRTPTPAPTPPATPVTTPAGSVAANPNSGPSANPTPSAPPIAVPTTNAAAKPQPVAPPVATVVSNSPGVPVVRAAPVVNTPEPPLEIVRVEDGPTLKIARDASPEVPPAARPSPVATVTAPTNPPAPTPTPVTPTTATLSAATMSVGAPPTATATEPEPAEKKTFWKRVSPANWGNPVKWFRGDEASARTNTPPPAPSQVRTETVVRKAPAPASPTLTPPPVVQVPEAVVVAPTPTPAPTPAPTPPPKPVVPRYAKREALSLAPGNRVAAQAQAQVAESASDREAVLAAWQRVVELDPSWTAAWLQTGRAALNASNIGVALRSGEAATTLDPASAPAHQLFAAALARAGFPKDAADHLERSVALAPGNPAAHLALAGLYARDLAEADLARPHYEKVLLLDPKNPQAGAIRMWLANNP